ncbi:MAG: GNAT family N-acetyltransferase [Candidatus Limnocylindria bacterium]
MALPADLDLRTATGADLPVIGALREAVGWTSHAWALRAVLEPAQARCVVVVDELDRIVGVGSGISYGVLGVVGNMVVAEDHRRRGIGTTILEAIIDFLSSQRDCVRLELNATPDGRPLYERHGFATIGASATARVGRGIGLEPDASVALRRASAGDLDALAAFDRPRFGGDRRVILELLLGDSHSTSLIAESDGEVVGYAHLRLDAPRIGPLLADAPSVAATLVQGAFDLAPSVDELRVNLPPGNRAGADWLRALGVAIEPWEGRMARGPQVPRRDATIYGMAMGALG